MKSSDFYDQISVHILEEFGGLLFFCSQCDLNSADIVSLGALTFADKSYDATQSQGL